MITLCYQYKMTRQAYMMNISVLIVLMFFFVANARAGEVYKVGVVPQFSARQLHDIWQPVIEQLNKKTGYRFELLSKPSIPDFEAAILAGEFDIAYMNPYHMLIANQSQGYIPMVRDRSRMLQGILAVHKDSGINDPVDLDNQHFAFPSPNALGASLLIRQELKDKYKIKIFPHYVKTHDSVYLNVALKQVVAGGGVQKTFDKQAEPVKEKLKIIYRTNKVVTHPVAFHPRVPVMVAEKIQNALISLGDEKSGRELLKLIPIRRIGAASLPEYESLKRKNFVRFIGGVN